MPAPVEKCALCGCAARIVAESVPGYQEGKTYTIYECESCFCSFAVPLAVDETLYGHIYNDSQCVPGYNRYYHYAREVLNRKRPLDYLSRQEESYWAVALHLRKRRNKKGTLKILEVGCGMGYFTYALAQDGFNVTGIDISPQALGWALEHYGPYYANTTLHDLKAEGNRYDVIIMNQLIEHLPDVHAFISDALGLISLDGELIITTPNKSACPGAEWETELPPVHLWWFGEEALRCLAQHHNCAVMFVDFGPFYNSFCRIKTPSTPVRSRQPIFDAHGTLVQPQYFPSVTRLRRMLEQAGIVTVLHNMRAVLANAERWRGARGPICAAVLRRTR